MRVLIPARAASKAAPFTLLALALAVAACGGQRQTGDPDVPTGGDNAPPGILPPHAVTEQGQAIEQLYVPILIIATAIFIVVEGLLIWSILRYRRRDETLPEQIHGNNKLELLWTIIPTIIVIGMFAATLGTLQKVDARAPQPEEVSANPGAAQQGTVALNVNVTGFQWQWTFEYPQLKTAAGTPLSFTGVGNEGPEMVVPVNEIVRVNLLASDVIHSFYVPQFLFKRDVIPGVNNQFDFKATRPGTFAGQCAEFCGLSHAQMLFTVRAVPRGEFDRWVAEQKEKAKPKPTPAAGGSPAPGTIEVSASNSVSFDQPSLDGPANTPLTFVFTNKDPAAPHNVAIENAGPNGDFVGQPIAQPSQTVNYGPTDPLPAGVYNFYCSVHPNTMRGTLTTK